jgi:hypothetical protein
MQRLLALSPPVLSESVKALRDILELLNLHCVFREDGFDLELSAGFERPSGARESRLTRNPGLRFATSWATFDASLRDERAN